MTVALNVDWSAGKATLTTVLSINAMLLPRMAAARIQAAEEERVAGASVGEGMSGYGCNGSGKGSACLGPTRGGWFGAYEAGIR